MKNGILYFLAGAAVLGAVLYIAGRSRRKDQPGPEVQAALVEAKVKLDPVTRKPLISAIKQPFDASIGATVSPAVSRGAKGIF